NGMPFYVQLVEFAQLKQHLEIGFTFESPKCCCAIRSIMPATTNAVTSKSGKTAGFVCASCGEMQKQKWFISDPTNYSRCMHCCYCYKQFGLHINKGRSINFKYIIYL